MLPEGARYPGGTVATHPYVRHAVLGTVACTLACGVLFRPSPGAPIRLLSPHLRSADAMDLEEEVLMLALSHKKIYKNKCRHPYWVDPLLCTRLETGQFSTLFYESEFFKVFSHVIEVVWRTVKSPSGRDLWTGNKYEKICPSSRETCNYVKVRNTPVIIPVRIYVWRVLKYKFSSRSFQRLKKDWKVITIKTKC